MLRYIYGINAIILYGVVVVLAFNSNCSAFDIGFGGKRSYVPRLNPAPIDVVTRPLHAIAKPLAKEGSWNAYLDEEDSGNIYYFNTVTGERTWNVPSETFPTIPVEQWISDNVEAFRLSELDRNNNADHVEHDIFAPTATSIPRTNTHRFGHHKRWNNAFGLHVEQPITDDTSPLPYEIDTLPTSSTSSSKFGPSLIIDIIPESKTVYKGNDVSNHEEIVVKEETAEITVDEEPVIEESTPVKESSNFEIPTSRFKIPTTFKVPTTFKGIIHASKRHPIVESTFDKLSNVDKLPTILKRVEEPLIVETPINKLMDKNILKQEDNEFIVTKDVFEDIKEKTFKIRERIENTKSLFTGFIVGGLAVSPIVALQDIIMKLSFSSDAINEFQFHTIFCSFQCAVFAMMLRFCVQGNDVHKEEDLLKNGFVVSSAVLRTMIMTSNIDFGWPMIQQLIGGGLESFAMFTAVYAAFDYGCMNGLLSRSTNNK